MRDNTCFVLVMNQNLGHHNSSECKADVMVAIQETRDGEKSSRCNQDCYHSITAVHCD